MRSPKLPRALLLLALLACSRSVGAQAPRRVETSAALAQIVKRVEPVVPPEAAKARIGGAVIADVTINPTGAVSTVTILDGQPLLHAAAERAIRQWTFKPFLHAGKPAAVQVILEVRFPDPVKDEQDRIFETYRASNYECQRQLEADASKAEVFCAKAAAAADALPADRVLERSHTVADYAHSLMAAGRTREAIAQFDRARQIRGTRVKRPDADTADLHLIVAVLHQQIGEHEKADAEFAAAVAMHAAAQEQLPSMRDRYAPRLQQALIRYAALKRARGDAAGAEALEARASGMVTVAEPSGDARRVTTRTAGNLQIAEPTTGRLTENDLQQIRAVLAAEKRPWRLELMIHPAPSGAPANWRVDAFLPPDVAASAFRRGRYVMLTTMPPPGVQEPNRVWRAMKGDFRYVQVAAAETDAAAMPPIRVQPAPNSPPPSDDELISIVSLIRARAAPKPTERLMSDIQPWPITSIIVWGTGETNVQLDDPSDARGAQHLRLRQQGGRWAIVEMR